MKGTLHLYPSTISEESAQWVLPAEVQQHMVSLRYYVVENIRTARRFLKKIDKSVDIDSLEFFVMDKHTTEAEQGQFLQPLLNGHDVGLLSEAGAPAVADPGAFIVQQAHKKGIRVVPYVGPSSILLALMASGLNGQHFTFLGYLPVKKPQRSKAIKQLENRSLAENQTQIFIEAPYRNMALLDALLQQGHPGTLLCIASNLTAPDEFIATRTLAQWKKQRPDLHKKPTLFLLHRLH